MSNENDRITYWWTFPFSCPSCDQSGTIVDVSVNSMSQILLEGICIKCGSSLQSTIDMNGTLIRRLVEMDMDKAFEVSGEEEDEQHRQSA